MESGELKNREDLDLASRVVRGDLSAWHEFVLRYSGLIRSIVRRYHPWKNEDDQLTLYVGVLERCYRRELARYDGRAALSTWIMTVARSRVLDVLRHEYGRQRPPRWVESLSPLERRVHQLHFMEFQSVPATLHVLARDGMPLEEARLEEIIARLSERMDPASLRRLAYDREARSSGLVSGRLIEVIDRLHRENARLGEACRPDRVLFEKQTREILAQIAECVRTLGEDERRLLELRYYDSLSMPAIARRLALPGPRRARYLIERALSSLRQRLRQGLEPSHRSD